MRGQLSISRLLVQLIGWFLTPTITLADAESLQQPQRLWFEVPQPNPTDIAAKYSEGMEIAQWWANLGLEAELRQELTRLRAKSFESAAPLIEWTGQGVLFKLDVALGNSPQAGGWFDARILGGGPRLIGPGASPEEAMFQHELSRGAVVSGVPNGYTIDPTYSHYYWVTRGADGELHDKVVPRGMAADLRQRVQADYARLEAQYQRARYESRQSWIHMASVAQQHLSDDASRRKVDASLQVLLDSTIKVTDIDRRLKGALDESARLAKVHNTLALLGATFNAAQLAEAATTINGKEIPGTQDAQSAKQVLSAVVAYRDQNNQLVIQLRTDYNRGTTEVETALQSFGDSLGAASPPPIVLQSFSSTTVSNAKR